ncbi:MAG TPA: hypothetical protein VNO52_14510 [Methylomirabilota bacterium]|nr:hypothetical protein [Methylomirabilota bacterium]
MHAEGWAELSDEALLEKRIRQLGLTLHGTPIEKQVQRLHQELIDRGQVFLPPCHIGDEWFCPVGIPAIFIPFFLVHDRLRRLERKMMLEVEGDTDEAFMKLMRHEAAHAYSYAYLLHQRPEWQEHFGQPSDEESPECYRPRPYSRSFVIHLDDWYAQSHPDEDFAETFAVWLTPGEDWRARYRGWKALRKVEFVDELMRSIAGQLPVHQPKFRPADYDCLNQKLKTYYARKRKLYEDTYPDFYDADLQTLFAPPAPEEARRKASDYLRAHRRQILNTISRWTKERRYPVHRLLNRLIARCDALGLRVRAEDPGLQFEVASYITCLVMNYLFTGKFKRTK